jgi:hypothetical protein
MTKQDFIEKWISWVSQTELQHLQKEMDSDLEEVAQALRIHDVVGRSEQLKAFAKMVANDDLAYLKDAETLLKDFESL